jgi:glycosyltransferase involved in cell wall biosynthesis
LFFQRMIRHAAAIHCLSEREAQDARSWGRPVFLVGNGTDLSAPDPGAQTACPARPTLVSIGRLDVHTKGLDLLLEACGRVRGELVAAGATVELYGPHVADSARRLDDLIERYRLQDLVRVLGPRSGAEKLEVLRLSAALVQVSRFEGQPTAVLQALAAGTPCLVSHATGLADLVTRHGAGWAVSGTPEGIASGLLEVVRDLPRRSAMGRAARSLAEAEFSWARIARCVIREYERVLGARLPCT